MPALHLLPNKPPPRLRLGGMQPSENMPAGEYKVMCDYVGSSVAMIEQNYCARLQLRPSNQEVFEKLAKNFNDIMVVERVSNPPPA
jgi:hypothetical protein